MKLILSILAALAAVIFGFIPDCKGAVCPNDLTLQAEIPTIRKAAERNGIKFGSDDWFLLLAIRKSENGARPDNAFGIMNPKAYNFDKQAGWCSASIVKHHKRFGSDKGTVAFINSLADRYCPAETDPEGNVNWKRNARYWFEKFKSLEGK